ncbi:MAG: hypothetical protein ACI8VE_002076, partial [Natrialbaceae archaeon]
SNSKTISGKGDDSVSPSVLREANDVGSNGGDIDDQIETRDTF